MPPPTPRRRRRRRRAILGLAALSSLALAATMALPSFLETPRAREWLLDRANAALAPATLEVGRFEFSWFAPTVFREVALVDAGGRPVVSADRAICERTLFGLLFDRPSFGEIDLGDARWDLARDAEGRVNLVEALRPILTGNPELSLTVRAAGGAVALRSPDLPGPISAGLGELVLDVPRAPDPWSWRVRLDARGGPGRFESEGTFERWKEAAPGGSRVAASYRLRDWEVARDGLEGTLSCAIDQGADGRWGGEAGGRVSRLAFGGLDLASAGAIEWSARGGYEPEGQELELASLDVAHPWGTLAARGKVGGARSDDPSGILTGELTPAAPAFERASALVEQPVALGCESVRFEAELSRGRSLAARIGNLDLAVGALTLAVQPIKLDASPSEIRVGAIEAAVNGGRLHLSPRITRDPERGWVFALGPDSFVEGMSLDDDLSRAALSYIAPVLAATAEISGRASARVGRAEWALGREPVVEGEVVFSDLRFAPGPLGRGLLALLGRGDAALTLDRPILLEVAGGKVRQRGLSIPIGDSRVDVEGSVGFDRSLALEASLPIPGRLAGSSGFLSDVVRDQRVIVPVTGTLDQPRIDGESFRRGLGELGKSVARRTAVRGILGLLRARKPD